MPQSQPIESSIIIPVYNQWELTRNCLVALRQTLSDQKCEIIIIDNASTDATKSLCAPFGKELLGEKFHYYRSETNLNFGPASNFGAQKAKGEFLVFLNNDTVPTPGWYAPLIEDFATYPDIAAIGPLLVYPEKGPLGRTVQHLGVSFTPKLTVAHLYEGIPETSPLVQKRRFFQVITAACLVMRRELFMQIGMFDEEYINGCEDIDLCARLCSKGFKMTVNPSAKVIHHTSQTAGRFDHNEANFKILSQKIQGMIKPDWHLHLSNDGAEIKLTPWLMHIASHPQEQVEALNQTLSSATLESLSDLLTNFPLWQEGYEALIPMLEKEKIDPILLDISYDKLFRDREKILLGYMDAFEIHQAESRNELIEIFCSQCPPYETYISQAQAASSSLKKEGFDNLAEQYTIWLTNQQEFRDNHYLPALYSLYKSYALSQNENPIPYETYIADGYTKSIAVSARFDDIYYKRQHPELLSTGFPPFMHYVLIGKAAGALHNKPKNIIPHYDGTYQPMQDVAFTDESCRLIAWYLPQFHPIPENNCAWGTGFTEWTNVTSAKPRFNAHYQPRLPGVLGFYDLRRKETLEEQIALAKHAGIYGFCFHHYWFHGHKIMRTPLEHLKDDPSLDFPFCLHWANEPWTKRWDGSNRDIIINQQYSPEDDLAFIRDIDWALRDSRYMKFQGKPMLGIYRPDLFPDIAKSIQLWRDYCRAEGIGELFLFASLSFYNTAEKHMNLGFDASVEYPPHGLATPPLNHEFVDKGLDYYGYIRNYKHTQMLHLDKTDINYTKPVFRGVMPGWDNTARSYDSGQLYVEATPQAYGKWLATSVGRAKQDSYTGEKHIFINAWNEWAECAYLEPDARYGAAMLNTTARTIAKKDILPHILFICNTDDKEQADRLESILVQNKANPQFKPVILAPLPVQSIESFKGLAPLIASFSNANKKTLLALLGKAGYFSFEMGVILHNIPLPHEFAEGIFAVCQNTVVCPQTNEPTNPLAYATDTTWIACDTLSSLPAWRLTNTITMKENTTRMLLRRAQQTNADKKDVSIIILPTKINELDIQNLLFAHQYTPLALEIITPQIFAPSFKQVFPEILGVESADGDLAYLRDALREAKGKAVWLLDLSEPSSANTPRALFVPFLERRVVSARPYLDKKDDCLLQLAEKHTIAISGQELMAAAKKQDKAVLPYLSQSLFRRDSALTALDQCHPQRQGQEQGQGQNESFDRQKFVKAVYALGDVAIVPSELE